MNYTRYISQLFVNEPQSLEILFEVFDKREISYSDLCKHVSLREKLVDKLQELGVLYIDKGIICISQFGKDIVSKCKEEMPLR